MRRLAAFTFVITLMAAGSAQAVEVGISEQHAISFADSRLRTLRLPVARLIVPWDAASSEPARVQKWLDATAAAGMSPHVAFEHLRSERCPSSPCRAPTAAQYRIAVQRFSGALPVGAHLHHLERGQPREPAHRVDARHGGPLLGELRARRSQFAS